MLRHRKPLTAVVAVLLTLSTAPTILASESSAAVDSLWGASPSLNADHWAYPLTTWWRDRQIAGIQDSRLRFQANLEAANDSLTDAWSYLLRQQHPDGLKPVPVVDDALATVYQAITGIRIYPVAWALHGSNQLLLKLENRDAPEQIVDQILTAFDTRQRAALDALGPAPTPELLDLQRANAVRQQRVLDKMTVLFMRLAGDADAVVEHLQQEQQSLTARLGTSKAGGGTEPGPRTPDPGRKKRGEPEPPEGRR